MTHALNAGTSFKSAGGTSFRRIATVTVFLVCLVSSLTLSVAPANAASRGFTVANESTATLRLQSAEHVFLGVCDFFFCADRRTPMEFEGRPQSGSEIEPGDSQRWELKYAFSVVNRVQYGAKLSYKIEHTNAQVEYVIETTPTANNSTCEVIPADAGVCTAGGLDLTFRD